MTGWQGNEGNQGWQQQPDPYGPDPSYGYDPADPYGYGQDPYANYPPQYSTGGFAAQGYPPPPPPPPKRSTLPMVLSLIAIVIIVGAVVTIVLLNRNKDQAGPAPENDTTSEERTSPSERPPSERNTAPPVEPPAEGWTVIDNREDAGLAYAVPPGWAPTERTRSSGEEGIDFSGVAEYGIFSCEGDNYVRSFATSGNVQGQDGTDADPAEAVTHFANSFATAYFGQDATVEVPEPTESDVNGTPAVTVVASVTVTPTKPACQATSAEVAVIGVPYSQQGQPNGVAMLVVVSDLAGGPAEPAPTTSELAAQILATVRTG